MVKIIQVGSIRCYCPHCNSLLEASKSDFTSKQKGIQEYGSFITCPVCQYEIESCYWKPYSSKELEIS